MRTLIRGGRVITSSQDYVADVLVEDEKIAAIGTFDDLAPDVVIDASNKYIIPGGIDPHTHFDLPYGGTAISDDFRTGTIAAAVGGTTTIIDFPFQARGEDLKASVDRWFEKAEGKVAIDYGFHQMLIDLSGPHLSQINSLVAEGITSFKLFMAYPKTSMVDDGTIFRAMQRAAELGTMIMIHAENGWVIDALVSDALERGNTQIQYHGLTRPPRTEGEATARAIALAEIAGSSVYIVHLSTADALEAVIDGMDRGVRVYAETLPIYLAFTEDKVIEAGPEGTKYLVTPPLRSAIHVEALWKGLKSGSLQVVSTDHGSVRFKDEKLSKDGTFATIPTGVPGVEWRVGLMHDLGVLRGRLSLNRWVEVVSTNAAKLFGLYPRKGEIAPGSDADLVVFDPKLEFTISADSMATNCDYTPYEGMTVRGWPEVVLLRGQVIARAGKYVGTVGQGKFLRRGVSGLH